jgi:hypothetical protein
MSTPRPTSDEPLLKEPTDFSLVLGGPLYQLLRRTRLAGDALELLRRRIVVLALLAWVPLLALSFAEGHAWGGSVKLPFLHDFEIHVRLLLALPLLWKRFGDKRVVDTPISELRPLPTTKSSITPVR